MAEGGPGGEGAEGETAEAQARSMVMKDLAEGTTGQVRTLAACFISPFPIKVAIKTLVF